MRSALVSGFVIFVLAAAVLAQTQTGRIWEP